MTVFILIPFLEMGGFLVVSLIFSKDKHERFEWVYIPYISILKVSVDSV